jgi:hypothetical protein
MREHPDEQVLLVNAAMTPVWVDGELDSLKSVNLRDSETEVLVYCPSCQAWTVQPHERTRH